MTEPLRVAIVGPTGYTGYHLARLLARHPHATLAYLASHRDQLPDLRDEFPQLTGLIDASVARCRPIDPDAIADAVDVAFLALPHKAAMAHVPALLDAGVRIVDLSADYRLNDADLYERVYDTVHDDPTNLATAVYGIPELFRSQLPGATLVANPGCYPTAAAIAIAPLLSHALIKPERILISAASGVSGAGRSPKPNLHFPELFGSFAAYGQIGSHRHQPEIAQTLTRVAGRPIDPLFVPHLLPIEVGILETIYLEPVDDDVTQEDLFDAYRDAYDDEPFVRIREADQALPNTKHVANTNFADLTVRLVEQPAGHTIVAFAAIDNLMKGAASQAIQNMNAVFELDETLGLI